MALLLLLSRLLLLLFRLLLLSLTADVAGVPVADVVVVTVVGAALVTLPAGEGVVGAEAVAELDSCECDSWAGLSGKLPPLVGTAATDVATVAAADVATVLQLVLLLLLCLLLLLLLLLVVLRRICCCCCCWGAYLCS